MGVATTILLGGFLTLLLIIFKKYYYVHKFARDHKVPPGPTYYPLIGVLPELYSIMGMRNAVVCKWIKQKYGDFAAYFAGEHYTVFMNDYSLNKEIASSDAYDGRLPQHCLSFKSYFKVNRGILFSMDDNSLKMRSFALRTLRRLKFAQRAEMGEILKIEMEEVIRGVDEAREANGNRVVLFDYIKWSIFSTMWTYLAGDSFPVSQTDLEQVTEAAVLEDEHSGMATTIEWYLPWLRNWSWIAEFPKLVKSHKIITDFIGRVIKDKRENESYHDPRDYIDYFIKEIEQNPNQYFNDENLKMMCNDFLTAGVVTTANSIIWATYHITKNPRVYLKLMNEIDEVVGVSVPDLIRDGPNMPYLDAIINETLRMENVVPVVSRSTNKVTEIKGYHIPANAMIIIDFDGPNKDPSLWDKPEIFNPDRFLDENKNIKKFEHFNPFGFGRRMCIGEKPARISMFYHIINIFQNYDFIVPDDVVRVGGVSTNFAPFEIYLMPREKPKRIIQTIPAVGVAPQNKIKMPVDVAPIMEIHNKSTSPMFKSSFSERAKTYQSIMEDLREL